MKWVRVLKIIFAIQAFVNLIGALSPELSFDALWYHLPIARLLAERGWWGTIPGGLIYYSGLPRLGEFISAGLLVIGKNLDSPEVLPKLLMWGMGMLSSLMICKIAKRYTTELGSYAVAITWYTTLLVGWQSMVVYVDLLRTALVLLAVDFLINKKPHKSALIIGLAYSVKILSGFEGILLAVFWGIIRCNWKATIKYLIIWLPFVLVWGGLNVYQGYQFFYPLGVIKLVGNYANLNLRNLFGPMVGDGRYILPEIALLMIVIAWRVVKVREYEPAKKVLLGFVILHAIFGITYRAAANTKFIPYLLGRETKDEFLSNHLNFGYGDWYDTDKYVRDNLQDKKYLVINIHNTYYLPGKLWEHESFVIDKTCFPYAIVQGEVKMGEEWEEIHEVEKTKTKIYKNLICNN